MDKVILVEMREADWQQMADEGVLPGVCVVPDCRRTAVVEEVVCAGHGHLAAWLTGAVR